MRALTISLIFMIAFAEAGVCQAVSESRVVVHLRGADGKVLPQPVTVRADRIDCTERQIVLARGRDIVALFDPEMVAFLLREDGVQAEATASSSGMIPTAAVSGTGTFSGTGPHPVPNGGSGHPSLPSLPNQTGAVGGPPMVPGAPPAIPGGVVAAPGGVSGDPTGAEAQIRAILSTALFRYLSTQIGGGGA